MLDATMRRLLANCESSEVSIKIITGKGLHSGSEGAVLPREVHAYFHARYQSYIIKIDDSPHQAAIDGIPIRGHFTAHIRLD